MQFPILLYNSDGYIFHSDTLLLELSLGIILQKKVCASHNFTETNGSIINKSRSHRGPQGAKRG